MSYFADSKVQRLRFYPEPFSSQPSVSSTGEQIGGHVPELTAVPPIFHCSELSSRRLGLKRSLIVPNGVSIAQRQNARLCETARKFIFLRRTDKTANSRLQIDAFHASSQSDGDDRAGDVYRDKEQDLEKELCGRLEKF
jgi:hypothetical protein